MIIKQRGAHDCGIAAFAMALGVTYWEAKAALGHRDPSMAVSDEWRGERYVGIIPEEFSLAAFKRGIPCHVVTVMEIQDHDSWMHAWRDVFFRMRIEDVSRAVFDEHTTAIIGVESKNHEGRSHWVTVKRGQVLDPSRGKCYEQGEVLPMQCAVLFKGV